MKRPAAINRASFIFPRPRAEGKLGSIISNLIDLLAKGQPVDAAIQQVKDDLIREYLYNWVDEIDEGVRHWGELGLAFTKALWDPQSRRDLQNKVGEKF